jgi:hypothetical protein
MAFAKRSILPAAEERRRFQRVKVHLLGRYMLPDRREFPCQIINMSPGGLALLAPGIGNVGDRVIAYLDISAGSRARSPASSTMVSR